MEHDTSKSIRVKPAVQKKKRKGETPNLSATKLYKVPYLGRIRILIQSYMLTPNTSCTNAFLLGDPLKFRARITDHPNYLSLVELRILIQMMSINTSPQDQDQCPSANFKRHKN